MTINKTQNGTSLVIELEGRLEALTAPELEQELKGCLDGITELTYDFQNLDYVSSAGLRILLSAQKKMSQQGSMKVINVNELVMEVFNCTGFTDILTIE